MNQLIYNSSSYPLYVSDLNTSGLLAATKLGNAYMLSATHATTLVLAGTVYLAINLRNPNGSGRKVYINDIYISTSGLLTGGSFLLIQNGTTGTTTNLTPRNINLGSPNTSICTSTMQTNTGITGGTTIGSGNLPTGIYAGIFEGGLAIQPNNALGISVAQSGTLGLAITLYVRITYWEELS